MTAMTKMTTVEAKLFVREPMAVFWGLLFPALLLVVLGAFFPGFTDPIEDVEGLRLINRPVDVRMVDLYAPIVLGLGLATLAISALPVTLATSRQHGVLRRLSTTPVPPSRLLIAQLSVYTVTAMVAAFLAIGVGVVAFDVAIPQNLGGFLLVLLLAAASLLAVGLLVGAVAPGASAAQGIGLAIYFPMLFFAGVYFPREAMPEGLRTVSDLTPVGAGVQALGDTWWGAAPAASNLLVMGAYAIVAGLLAAGLFRWE